MKIQFSSPSKTFLMGEYLALHGGPSFVINTEPRFSMLVETVDEDTKPFRQIHPHSPAGRLIQKNQSYLKNLQFTFEDPHRGAGGFGASSAQFLFLYILLDALKEYGSLPSIDFKKYNEPSTNLIKNILAEFHSYYRDIKNPPSGADLIGQWSGGVTYFDGIKQTSQSLQWPFADLDFLILKTNYKVRTHEHLADLELKNLQGFRAITLDFYQQIANKNSQATVNAINNFRAQLKQQDLELSETTQTIEIIKAELQIRPESLFAIKGCGALGADVILVVFSKSYTHDLNNLFPTLNLTKVADTEALSDGFKAQQL